MAKEDNVSLNQEYENIMASTNPHWAYMVDWSAHLVSARATLCVCVCVFVGDNSYKKLSRINISWKMAKRKQSSNLWQLINIGMIKKNPIKSYASIVTVKMNKETWSIVQPQETWEPPSIVYSINEDVKSEKNPVIIIQTSCQRYTASQIFVKTNSSRSKINLDSEKQVVICSNQM